MKQWISHPSAWWLSLAATRYPFLFRNPVFGKMTKPVAPGELTVTEHNGKKKKTIVYYLSNTVLSLSQ